MRTITSETLRENAARIRRHHNPLHATADNLETAASTIDRLERRLDLSLSRAAHFRDEVASAVGDYAAARKRACI